MSPKIAKNDMMTPNAKRLVGVSQILSKVELVSISKNITRRGIQETAVHVPPRIPPINPSIDLAGEIF